MKPLKKDIEIRRGDTFELFFRVRTRVWNPALNGGAGGYEPGPYRDLTGYTVTSQFRSSEDAADPALTFTCTLTNQTTTPGGVLVRATPAQTAALTIFAGGYDVQLATAGMVDAWTYIEGTVTVDKDWTR